jgi:hypothetical protein
MIFSPVRNQRFASFRPINTPYFDVDSEKKLFFGLRGMYIYRSLPEACPLSPSQPPAARFSIDTF